MNEQSMKVYAALREELGEHGVVAADILAAGSTYVGAVRATAGADMAELIGEFIGLCAAKVEILGGLTAEQSARVEKGARALWSAMVVDAAANRVEAAVQERATLKPEELN